MNILQFRIICTIVGLDVFFIATNIKYRVNANDTAINVAR